MSTDKERQLNDLKVDFIIKEAAGNNKSAFEYLHLMAASARIADDIKDEPEKLDAKKLMQLVEYLFISIPGNQFFQKHQDMLFAQHIVLWNAWEASNSLEKGDETDRIYAHVLRDYINELLPLVAF